MPRNFADRLLDKIDEMKNPSVIGLDPRIQDIPKKVIQNAIKTTCDYSKRKLGELTLDDKFRATAQAFFDFNVGIIDSTCEIAGICKPQYAFYDQYGHHGVKAFEDTIEYARSKGMLRIGDKKKNDIKDTAQAYADGALGVVELADGSSHSSFDLDALTVNGYLGSDGIKPFVDVSKRHGKGIFLLVKTSNASSGELQDLVLDPVHGGRKVYEQMALKANQWGEELLGERGYSSLGVVVGATFPTDAVSVRKKAEKAIILVPGYGFQGGMGKDTVPNFNKDGYGAIVNSSRGINFAYKSKDFATAPENYGKAAANSAESMRNDILTAMKDAGIIPDALK
ncbi:MAG: orotidine-5'-phosphate decarboxylase [Candidatus Aenigmatarchaeota archaeon]